MSILVSDTSVIVDLERGKLLEHAFKLPYGFVVPDALYRHELASYGGERLIALGLRIEALTSEELTTAAQYKQARARLSVPDVYAFALAFHRGWTLLAGDGELRNLAKTEKLELHGVLWVLDECVRHCVCKADELLTGLTAISAHPRCRLPHREIEERLRSWRVE